MNNVSRHNFSTDDDDTPGLLTKRQLHEIIALLKSKDSLTISPSTNHIQIVAPSSSPSMSGISLGLSAISHTNTNAT